MTLDDDSAILTLPPSPPESLAPGNHRSKQHHYALTSSACASSMGGTVRPSVLAVFSGLRRARECREAAAQTFLMRSWLVRRASSSLNFASAGLTTSSSNTSINRSTEG